jgi:hypothetical protein
MVRRARVAFASNTAVSTMPRSALSKRRNGSGDVERMSTSNHAEPGIELIDSPPPTRASVNEVRGSAGRISPLSLAMA